MSTSQSVCDAPPPPFSGPHKVELAAIQHGTISHVNLYPRRAEVTRVFRFPVQVGLNQVTVAGLPNVMDVSSLKVEGRGSATIQDVTIAPAPANGSARSTTLKALLLKQTRLQSSLSRTQKSLSSLDRYLNSITPEHTEPSSIPEFLKTYETTATDLDDKIQTLRQALEECEEEIKNEKLLVESPDHDDIDRSKLNMRATIGVFADIEGPVEIALTYAVTNASWSAAYDIRVNLNAKEKQIELLYRASIIQSTGEPWSNVSLTLETASPSFGVGIPTLYPWNLSVYTPSTRSTPAFAKSLRRSVPHGVQSFSLSAAPAPGSAESSFCFDEEAPSMEPRAMKVGAKDNNVIATFEVPGLITIPSDNEAHNVTVAKLELDASMTWICVPRKDTKFHLKANIQNASDYTLLPGVASVYLDGSFIARSHVPQVSPQEVFECPLGVDPAIRATYHPLVKKRGTQTSMFSSKTSSHMFSQQITIHNTKRHGVKNLRVIDHIPVSQDQAITVKLLKPALPQPEIGEGKNSEASLRKGIKVADGIVAQWEGADDLDFDGETLGKDGKLNWNCELPSQGKVNLLLSWEVSAPLKTEISGLP